MAYVRSREKCVKMFAGFSAGVTAHRRSSAANGKISRKARVMTVPKAICSGRPAIQTCACQKNDLPSASYMKKYHITMRNQKIFTAWNGLC